MDIDNGIVKLNDKETAALKGKELPSPLTLDFVANHLDQWMEEVRDALDKLEGRDALVDEDPRIDYERVGHFIKLDALAGMAGNLLAFETEQSLI